MILTATINEVKRRITFDNPNAVVAVKGDYEVNGVAFAFPAIYEDDFDLSTAVKTVYYKATDGIIYNHVVTDTDTDTGYPLWVFKDEINKGAFGDVEFALVCDKVEGGNIVKRWVSMITAFRVQRSIEIDESAQEDNEQTYSERLAYLMAQMANMQVAVNGLASGAPTAVSLASAMTDTSKLYVYTGSESGYTAGHWYYYNGSAWADGGVYGGTSVDATLTVSGAAADAKVTGDKIAEIKEDLSVLNTISTPLSLIWEQGTYNVNTGAKNAATNRVRTKYKVSLNSLGYIVMYCPAGWQLGGRRYTQNNAQTYLGTIPAFTGMKLLKHAEHTMYTFYVRRDDNADITPSDVPDEVKIIPIYLPYWDTNAHGLSVASFRTTRNNPLYVEQICDVAETYYDHRNDSTGGVADMQYGYDSATRVDTYTRQIDCSTFVTLCLLGIPYTETQYYTKTDTPASSLVPNPQYAWSVDPKLYDYYPGDLSGEPDGGARASQLAEWMIDMGWRVPKDKKLLNLEVGDILFYARTNESGSQIAQPDRFMCINHVAICTDKQRNTSDTGLPYTYTLTEVTNVKPCVRKKVVEDGWDTPDVINVNNYNTLVLICRPDLGSI